MTSPAGESCVVLVMGVSGSGKTTVGRLLAERLGCRFVDADDHHSPASIEKMARGEALTDSDRAPWLAALRGIVVAVLQDGTRAVLACSALKERYRAQIRVDRERVPVVYLRGDPHVLAARLRARVGHFAKDTLLASQLAALEEPTDALTLDVTLSPERIVDEIVRELHLASRHHRA
jgi:gluconokinase